MAGWVAGRLDGWLVGFGRNPSRIVNPNCVDFCLKTCRFGHLLAHPRGTHMLAGRLGGRLVGWLATTLRQKCAPLARKCAKMHTLKQKVDVEALQLLGLLNASKARTLSTKVRQKCVPLGRKSASKPFSFWGTRMRQKPAPLARKCIKNAYP